MDNLPNNVGELGSRSIRIGGKRVDELSVVEAMLARKQIALSEKEQRIKDIKDRYPKYRVPNMKAAIREARANIERFEEAIKREQKTIEDFSTQLFMCEQRDRELKAEGVDLGY